MYTRYWKIEYYEDSGRTAPKQHKVVVYRSWAERVTGYGPTPHAAYANAVGQLVIKPAFMDPPDRPFTVSDQVLLAAEFGFKCAERGMNIEATRVELDRILGKKS